MNLTRLVVLWLLSESRLHGYQIKRIISDPTLQFWFPIEYGSIYSVLRFLEKQGYAKSVTERRGKRPERTRYAITPKGRQYFRQLLREAWSQPSLPTQPIDVALAARPELPEEDVPPLLAARRASLVDRLAFLDRARRSAPAPEMVDRARTTTMAELRWLDELQTSRDTEVSAMEAKQSQPAIQLIANLVVQRPTGEVLFVRYDPDDERWWLPGEDLEPYEHPDEAARKILSSLEGLTVDSMTMHDVESFRGRRGWHVVFHYRVAASGDPTSKYPLQWFAPADLPRTMHGRWERDAVRRLEARSS
jgi:DNA-binding PadR family transcriptional regulator/ADP-ribose pyrophosphatase YjhB (NUDIX family)